MLPENINISNYRCNYSLYVRIHVYQVASKQDIEHSLYLTLLLLQLKWASLNIFDFSMYKRIIIVVDVKYIQIFYAYLNGPQVFHRGICYRLESFPPFSLYYSFFFVCFFIFYLIYYLFIYIMFVFLYFHFVSLSVYRDCWRMYVVPVIAQRTTSNGMALYCLLLLSTPLLPVS